MNTPRKEMRGMIFVIIGLLFSSAGMIASTYDNQTEVALALSILGVLIILYGLFRIFKANSFHQKS